MARIILVSWSQATTTSASSSASDLLNFVLSHIFRACSVHGKARSLTPHPGHVPVAWRFTFLRISWSQSASSSVPGMESRDGLEPTCSPRLPELNTAHGVHMGAEHESSSQDRASSARTRMRLQHSCEQPHALSSSFDLSDVGWSGGHCCSADLVAPAAKGRCVVVQRSAACRQVDRQPPVVARHHCFCGLCCGL